MKLFSSLLLSALLLFASADGFAAKRLSNRGYSYFPAFGLGSVASVTYASSASPGLTGLIHSSDGSATELMMLYSTTAAYIAVGTAPVASAAYTPIPAATNTIIEVPYGYKISAVPVTTAGILYATHITMTPSSQ